MLLDHFFPYYPSIDDEKEFNDQLYRKKEFYDNRLSSGLPELTESGYLQHQVIIARFLSPHTVYNGLFLFHEAGSGKTAATIGVCEEFFKNESDIRHVLVLVSNELLERRFVKEIVKLGGPRYQPDEEGMEFERPEQRQTLLFQRAKRKVRERYQVQTFTSFYSQYLKRTSPESWRQSYSNHIIIFDEVHKLVGQEGTQMYDTYNQFFHSLHNTKLIVMSGTPMRNDASEFARILNLILPADQAIPTTSSEFSAFLHSPLFLQRLIGRVSYLKTQTNIQKEYMGERIPPIEHFILYPSVMSERQLRFYRVNFDEDTGWYTRARQASQFSDRLTSREDVRRLFRGARGAEEKLTVLADYSAKYANAIRAILSAKKQNCFVFTTFIEPPGAILFGWCLEVFGFQQTQSGKESSPALRYAVLSDTGDSNPNIESIIEQFNRKRNNHGKFIRVLIGGTKVSVGVTFKNIQQIHVLTPTWHYSAIDQTIARGVRYLSHSALPPGTPVRIFLHVSISPELLPEETIDLIMYDRAQTKDQEIKLVEYLVKTHAFDCALTYHRNLSLDANDGSRECEYKQCAYTCYGIPITGPASQPYRLPLSELDRTTYELYYSTSDVVEFHAQLQEQFQRTSAVSLTTLYMFFSKDYSLILFLRLLHQVISRLMVFRDFMGFETYLAYDNGVVFLVQDGLRDIRLSDSFYQQFPVHQLEMTTEYTSMSVVHQFIQSEFTQMSVPDKILTFNQFGTEVQDEFVRQSIQSEFEFKEEDIPNEFGQWILATYKDHISRQPGTVQYKESVFQINEGRWEKAQPPERPELTLQIVQTHDVYGLVKDDVFSLVDQRGKPLSKRKLNAKGQNCLTMRKGALETLLRDLGEPNPPKGRRAICQRIQEKLAQRNLLF